VSMKASVCVDASYLILGYLEIVMVLLGVEPQVEACFGLFRDSVTLTQDMCTVCTE
jgi:hypothetical protein